MKEHVEYHRDGSIRAKGSVKDGLPCGYWEWFRLDGTILRSGHFSDGKQIGEWTTYNRQGKPFKTTNFDRKTTA